MISGRARRPPRGSAARSYHLTGRPTTNPSTDAGPGWDALLVALAETPRENGSAALHRSADFLREALDATGADTGLFAFTAAPYALRLAGVIALVAGILYFRLVRAGRFGAALAVAALAPALLLAQLELQLPVFGWVGSETQHHVVGRFPVAGAEQRLVFAAHYDTKTDALDHFERAPIELLAGPVVLLLLLGASVGRRMPRLAAVAAWAGLVHGGLTFVALSGGAFVPSRSPGALDDGASCAVLVRLAERLAAGPPLGRTEVEILLLSAEEVGVQGSLAYASERFSGPSGLPTAVVNLEGLGASADHGLIPSERFVFRSYPADPGLVARLDAVHREQFGKPLFRMPWGGATDARSFLARGIPAATLISSEGVWLPRGLHSARDDRSRLDPAALEASVGYLLAVARAVDSRGG